jgi:cellulase
MISNGDPSNPNYTLPDLTAPSIQRPYYWYPIEDPLSSNMSCNYNGISNAPSFHAPVPAGGDVSAFWSSSGGNSTFPFVWSWRHSDGPFFAYLARCPDDSCANFNPDGGDAVWFKIAQIGLSPGATNMQDSTAWLQSGINDGGWTVQIPPTLKSGAYLIRHEILMLAAEPAQFYPNCAQIMVTGGGDDEPEAGELVAFPGAYEATGEFILYSKGS